MAVTIGFDEERILWVLRQLADKSFFESRCMRPDPPEVRFSDGMEIGTKEHAQYLMIGIGFDQRRQSRQVYRAAHDIASSYSLEEIAQMPRQEVRDIVRQSLDDGISDPARMLHSCAHMVTEHYEGDPRKIFEGAATFEEARDRLLNGNDGQSSKIYGMGPFKASLMIKNFARFGYLKLEDEHDGTPKVDVHFTRMMLGNGGIRMTGRGEVRVHKLHKPLDRISHMLCRENSIDWISADDNKWQIGSTYCIRKSPQACYDHCPLDCSMLVRMNKSGSYIVYPSETRKRMEGIQLRLF